MSTVVRVLCDGRSPFTAGFVPQDGRVRECAPILRRHIAGRTEAEARAIIKAKGWRAHVVHPHA